MSVHCQHCAVLIATEHIKIGMTIDCPACGARTLLKYALGSSIPPTGWSISFADFAQLLGDASYRKRIAPMVQQWFDCIAESTSDGIILRKRDGALLTTEDAHIAIQTDAKKQYALYQAAMDLWR